MGSSDCERLISTITQSLPISEIIEHIKNSFRERHLNEVQNILRENGMKMEIENLMRDRDSAKDVVCFLERSLDLAELEKLKFEEKLQKTQRKCQELEKTVTRLIEEKRVSNDREEMAENSKMPNESNKLISELNEKINELNNKNIENELLVGVHQEKCKCLDYEIAKMGREIKDLRHENLECRRSIDELRLKKSESDKAAELYKSRLENLWPRIRKIEENLADMLTVKVGDLASLVDDLSKLPNSEEGGISEFPDSGGRNDRSGNVVVLWPGVRSDSNSTASRSVGLSSKGDRNLVRSGEDDAHKGKTSPGSRLGFNPPQPESSERKETLGSGAHASGTRLISRGHFSKIARSSSDAGVIIDIIDSDDETNPNGAADISNTGNNPVRSPSPKRSKRKRTDCMGGLFANPQTPIEKFNGLNDEVLTDSDESCSDSRIDRFIASLES